MAQAQNKLGELFVDIGVGGVGQALKSLNSVSATLLLAKGAAEATIKPLINIGKQSMNSAVEVGKLSAALGTTRIESLKFVQYLKEKNLSEGLIGDLTGLSNTFTEINAGFAGMSEKMSTAFQALGLDWMQYNGSMESTLQLVKDVQQAIKGMDANRARMYLNMLGMQPEWIYAFQRGDFNLGEALNIPDGAIENIIQTNEELNKLNNTWNNLLLKGTNWVLQRGGSETVTDVNQALKGDKFSGAKTLIRGSGALGGAAAGFAIGGPIGAGVGAIGGAVASQKAIEKRLEMIDEKELNPSDKAIPLPPLPNNLKSMNTSSIQINNNNNIYGNNADEIAEKIANISVQDIQMAQYQDHNMAGV